MLDADVFSALADITNIEREIGFKPQAKLLGKINDFVDEIKNYH